MRHVAHVAHTPHGTRQAALLVCLVGNVLHANEFHVLSLRSLVPLFVLPIVVARILVVAAVVAAVIEAVAIAVAVIWFWPSPPPPRRDLYRGRCNCRRPNAVQIPRKGVKCVKCTDPAECSCLPLPPHLSLFL